jgi:hypothetical protein
MQVSDWTKSGVDAPCSHDDNDSKRKDRKRRKTAGIVRVSKTVLLAALLSAPQPGHTRDDGRYANSNPELKAWFDSLKSGKGPCCSDADGTALSDVDWESKSGHYRVRLEGEWIDVPDDAVITTPNRIGRTMVWPMYRDGKITPRCFMPGSMT